MFKNKIDIERRIAIAVALSQYLRVENRFLSSMRDLDDRSSELSELLDQPGLFVTEIDYQHYLLTADGEGNFDIEPVQAL